MADHFTARDWELAHQQLAGEAERLRVERDEARAKLSLVEGDLTNRLTDLTNRWYQKVMGANARIARLEDTLRYVERTLAAHLPEEIDNQHWQVDALERIARVLDVAFSK